MDDGYPVRWRCLFLLYIFFFFSSLSIHVQRYLGRLATVMDIGRRLDFKNSKFCFNAWEAINGSDIK
jgi:hypothetical protein